MSISIPLKREHQQAAALGQAVVNSSGEWGWLPAIGAIVTLGLFITVLSYAASRAELPQATVLYWIGLFTQYIPVAARLLGKKASRSETIGLVVLLGFTLYLTKILVNPNRFAFSDELQQWRSLYNSLSSNALFVENPILAVSPYFPGLQNATHSLISISGLSIFDAAEILVGAIRLMLMLSLFLYFEQVAQSHRHAGLSSLIYMCNPAFLGWTSYYLYQSLALPLLVLVLYLVLRLSGAGRGARFGLAVSMLIVIPAVIVSHHVSSFALVGLLSLFAFVPPIWVRINRATNWNKAAGWSRKLSGRLSRPLARLWLLTREDRRTDFYENELGWLVLLVLLGTFVWIIYVAALTLGYLGAQISDIVGEVIGLLTGQLSRSSVYVAPDRPIIELVVGIASLVLLLVGVPFGMLRTLERYRGDSIAVSMLVGSLTFFVSLLIRFVSARGGELLGRIWPFLYLIIGFVLAVGILFIVDSRGWRRWPARIAMLAALVVLFAGGIVNGWPPHWSRLPGKYLVGAAERSVDEHSLAAANWAREHLDENSPMASDFVLHHILGGYGLQAPVLGMEDLFLNESFGPYHLDLLRDNKLEYLVVDTRMSEAVPLSGFYYGSWESTDPLTEPADRRALLKYDSMSDVSRIYDSGSIIFYDVHRLLSD